MPSSRRRNRTASEDQGQPLRKNPRRGKKAVNYASLDDDDGQKIDDDASDVEVLSEVEDDFLDEDMDDEVKQTRRSARVAKKDTDAYGERRVSTRANKATGNMDEASEDDFDTNGDSSEDSSVKAPIKTSARPGKNRLNVDSEYVQVDEDEDDDDDDDDEELIVVEAPKAKKKKEVKPQPAKEYEPFRISKIIAAMTLPLSQWREVCLDMNTSEITVGSRWIQDDDDDDDSQEETRFLIKWSDASYCHCSWETEDDLVNLIEKSKVAIKNFLAKCDDEGKIFTEDARNDGEYFDPAWLQVDRILEVHFPKGHSGDDRPEDEIEPEDVGIIMDRNDESYETALGRQFLVKWDNLPYSESGFEFERDLILCGVPYKDKVTEYNKRRTKTEVEIQQKQHDDGEAEFRRLYLEVFGEKSESQLKNDGVSVFQKALLAKEYPNGGQLRDYQAEGVSWLIANFLNKRSCILADEMGLGKTIQVCAFLDFLASKLFRRGPFLVVVPLSTLSNWKKECDGWLGLNTIVYHGSAEDRMMIRELEMAFDSDRPQSTRFRELYLKKCTGARSRSVGNPWMFDVLLTTPEIICSDDFNELTAIKWECLVVDEAQKMKNIKSKLSLNLRDSRFKCNQRLLLSGTPIQNSMEELFSLLNFVDPDLFKSCDGFMEKYGEMKSKEVLDVLHEEIAPFLLRRLKEDVEKSVPPKEETVIEVELTVAQKQYYRALFEKNVKFLHKNKKKALHGPSLNNLAMQLRKCCNHLFLLHGIEEEYCSKEKSKNKNLQEVDLLVSGSGKLVLLDKLLPRLKLDGHRILIFSQFTMTLNLLEDYLVLRDWSYERIDGSITGAKRQQAIERFQAADTEGKEQPFIMLVTTKAGGVGINLTAADTCIIFDSDWNPQNDLQAQARCHRIGQTKHVKVYRLLTRSTYEQRLFELASQKLGLDQAVLSGFETGKGGSLSKEQVERLLRHGAYEILNEDKEGAEAASSAFIAQDIDTILKRSHVIVHENTGSGSSAAGGKFSKARFSTSQPGTSSGQEQVDIDDPSFWTKMLGEPIDDDAEEIVVGKRSRTVNNYSEDAYDKKFLESYDVESGDEDDRDSKDKKSETRDDESVNDSDDDSFEQVEEEESDDDGMLEVPKVKKAVPKLSSQAPVASLSSPGLDQRNRLNQSNQQSLQGLNQPSLQGVNPQSLDLMLRASLGGGVTGLSQQHASPIHNQSLGPFGNLNQFNLGHRIGLTPQQLALLGKNPAVSLHLQEGGLGTNGLGGNSLSNNPAFSLLLPQGGHGGNALNNPALSMLLQQRGLGAKNGLGGNSRNSNP